MAEENRAHPRFLIRLGAEVKVGDDTLRGATFDVSRGGFRFETSRPLPEGMECPVLLRVVVDDIRDPDYPPLETRAMVRWSAESEELATFHSGMQFAGLTDAQGAWLEKVIARSGQ